MKKLLPLVGIAAACGICCAAPFIFASLAVSGTAGAVLGWKIGAAMLAGAAMVGGGIWFLKARRRKASGENSSCCEPKACGYTPNR